MERELGFKMVQAQIGYTFKNIDLLNQAFTRRSYTEENGGENNEVLEFIGDKALDFAVIKILIEKFGAVQSDDPPEGLKEFSCEYAEGELTKLKSRIVQKKNLAQRIEELGFAELLLMGKSDIKNHVSNEKSVKEDLFEAIVGAVTIDSGWNFAIIQSVVEAMLVIEDFIENDEDDNYVRLIQDWEMENNHVVPWFWFKEQPYQLTWYTEFNGISQNISSPYDYDRIKYHCELKLLDELPIFRGFGESKSEARMNVCKLAYEYLEENEYIQEFTMKDEIGEPSKDFAINQLEILARRGYFSIPTYAFEETHDEDGNPIWNCTCKNKEYKQFFTSNSSSKKDAKKQAAFKMLEFLINDQNK